MPAELGCCIAMEILELDSCSLTQVPNEIVGMTRLIELHLGNNRLEALPEGIGWMSRLSLLNVCDNQIAKLPLSL